MKDCHHVVDFLNKDSAAPALTLRIPLSKPWKVLMFLRMAKSFWLLAKSSANFASEVKGMVVFAFVVSVDE